MEQEQKGAQFEAVPDGPRQYTIILLVGIIGGCLSVAAVYVPVIALGVGPAGTILVAWLMFRSMRKDQKTRQLIDARSKAFEDRTDELSQANERLTTQNRELQATEQALRESEARYRLLAENVTDVIYTHDLDFNWTYISPSIETQLGYTVEQALSIPLWETMTPASFEASKTALREGLEAFEASGTFPPGAYRVLELEGVRKDGSKIYLQNQVSFTYDEAGKPAGVVGVSREITRRKQVEAEKQELEHQMQHGQKMEAIGVLAGGVAHDFNNLLTGILGYTDLIKTESNLEHQTAERVEVIEKAAQRAQQLTSQLLGFARKGKFQSVPVDLNESIRDVSTFLERTVDKSIDFTLELAAEPVSITGDPGQVHQLLLNLAVNARDAMPDGGHLTFRTETAELDEEFCRRHLGVEAGTYNIISVTDTGCGIAPENKKRIFEPFFTDKPGGDGTGMGLAMVYGVTRSHNGAVTVASKQGSGTTFRVFLPHTPLCMVDQGDEPQTELVRGSGRILVIDDEDILLTLADDMLEELGYESKTVADGAAACEWYRENADAVDLAIIDMNMPGMGGWECLQQLRAINPRLPVLMSTGYSRQDVAEQLNQNELVGFIQKPYQMQELSEAIADAISVRFERT